MCDIMFFQQRTDQIRSIWNCQQPILHIKKDLLFLHAFAGCDTTTAIYSKGKAKIVGLFQKSFEIQIASLVMNCSSRTQQEVGNAVVSSFKSLFGASSETPFETVRSCFVLLYQYFYRI